MTQARAYIGAGACCLIGAALLVYSSVTFALRTPEEVAVWYNIPLCQAETIVAGQPTYYLSRNTPASATTLSAACPDPSTLANDPANAETITAKIPSSYFIPGATYTTMAYYSSEARIDIRTNDSYAFLNVEVVGEFPEQSTAPENRRLEAVHDSPAGTHAVGPRRRLLKGGFGGGGYSGPSYRTRYGKRNYFGSTVHRRRYGRYGPHAVGSDTVVLLYSPGPIFSTRAASTTTFTGSTSSTCRDPTEGCEFTLQETLSKSEIAAATWKHEEGNGDYTLRVSARVNYNMTAASTKYPNLYISFQTSFTSPEALIGYILIPISCVILCFGTGLVLLCKDKLCGRRSYSFTQLSTSNSFAAAASAADSEVSVPMPTAQGRSMIRRNGSFTNLSALLPGVKTADFTSNDIRTCNSYRVSEAEVLRLNNNDLTSLDGISASCPQLVALDVTDNDISDLGHLSRLPKLEWLSVRNNKVKNLGGYRSGKLPSLTYLNAADNDLKHLAGIFNFPSLRVLDLSNNDITTVLHLAKSCPNLERVNLAQNNIIDPEPLVNLVNLPSMRYLNIKGNDMRAAQVQQVQDAADEKPNMRLVRQ